MAIPSPPFDPATFYSLATALQPRAKPNDATLRSVISRAYYGALITARDVAGLNPRGIDTHDQVITHYGRNATESMIATNLRSLRQLRNKADYSSSSACTIDEGLQAISQSKKVLQVLKRLPSAKPSPTTPPPSQSGNP